MSKKQHPGKPTNLTTEGYTALILRPRDPKGTGYLVEVFGPEGNRLYRSPAVEDLDRARDVAERYAAAHAESAAKVKAERAERALELVPWLAEAEDRIDQLKAQRADINARIKGIEQERRQRIEDAYSPQMSLSFTLEPDAKHGKPEPDAEPLEGADSDEESPYPERLPRKTVDAIEVFRACDDVDQLNAWLCHEQGLKRQRRAVIDGINERIDRLDAEEIGDPTADAPAGMDPGAVDWGGAEAHG